VTPGHESGERLHGGEPLFAVDLARHQAAYAFALRRGPARWLLDLGSGSGHGTAALAQGGLRSVGLDRVAPDADSRARGGLFVRGDLARLPFAPARFERVVSFQVIEHLADPAPYLAGLAGLLAPGGEALLSTPNRLASDGVNPHHAREYAAGELAALLREHFAAVEVLGVGASEPVRRYFDARARRVRRLLALDPLRLRERLPPAARDLAFARLARLVRWLARRREGLPEVDWRDYPIGPASDDCLDLLAICRQARRARSEAFALPDPVHRETRPGSPGLRPGSAGEGSCW
jgi:SAM-dependent methyltransferase